MDVIILIVLIITLIVPVLVELVDIFVVDDTKSGNQSQLIRTSKQSSGYRTNTTEVTQQITAPQRNYVKRDEEKTNMPKRTATMTPYATSGSLQDPSAVMAKIHAYWDQRQANSSSQQASGYRQNAPDATQQKATSDLQDATVVMAKCQFTKRPFGIRIEKRQDGDWYCTWAFKISEKAAVHEGYARKVPVSGRFHFATEYPGCPYCGATGLIQCHSCKQLSCDATDVAFSCGWCDHIRSKYSGKIREVQKIEITGRDY